MKEEEFAEPENHMDTIFTEEIPVIGRVPILFYLPQNCKESREIQRLIINHGGLVITVVECCTF